MSRSKKWRTERPSRTKIGTAVAHVTRDSDTTFRDKRSKVNLQGAGAYCGDLPYSLLSSSCGSVVKALDFHPTNLGLDCESVVAKGSPPL